MIITIGMLVHENRFTEEETREAVRSRLPDWKQYHRWVNVFAHTLSDCDTAHMRWILEELQADGQIWIAPFGEVAQYYLCKKENGAALGAVPVTSDNHVTTAGR
jgi:hypothetical protein